LLETAVLIALLKALQARHVFEIGTLYGLQTLNLAANLPPGGHVWTLDLDDAAFAQARQTEQDREISRRHLAAANELAFAVEPWAEKVTRLRGDSNLFDFTPYLKQVDLVYIDGGHDRRTVESDTNSALKMLDPERPGAVVWHDYGNPAYPEVQAALDEWANGRNLYAVAETQLAMTFNEATVDLVARLENRTAP